MCWPANCPVPGTGRGYLILAGDIELYSLVNIGIFFYKVVMLGKCMHGILLFMKIMKSKNNKKRQKTPLILGLKSCLFPVTLP